MTGDRNPSCSCGCGHEASRPTHKYILGHSVPLALHRRDLVVIKCAIEQGIAQRKIASWFGVSQTFVSNVRFGQLNYRMGTERHTPSQSRSPEHQSDIDRRRNFAYIRKTINQIQQISRKKGHARDCA